MGSRGPVPKDSSQRRRANAADVAIEVVHASVSVSQPAASDTWHPLAADWYVSLAHSGQAVFYQPSDWQSARVWAELLSRQLYSERMNSQMISAWAAGATELLTTEGARRRMRIELERGDVADPAAEHAEATVTDLMSRLGG